MAIALKEGRPIRNAEAIAERPDGSRVPFIPYPTPLRDAKGNASTCLRSGIPSSGCAPRPRRMPQRKAGPPMHSALAYSQTEIEHDGKRFVVCSCSSGDSKNM